MQPLYHSTDLEQTDRIKTVFLEFVPSEWVTVAVFWVALRPR